MKKISQEEKILQGFCPPPKKTKSKKTKKSTFFPKKRCFFSGLDSMFQISHMYPFFFRDGHLEKGKKIILEATKHVLNKTIKKTPNPLYKEIPFWASKETNG